MRFLGSALQAGLDPSIAPRPQGILRGFELDESQPTHSVLSRHRTYIDRASHSISLSNDSRNFAQNLPQPQFHFSGRRPRSQITVVFFLCRTNSLIGVPPNSRSPLAPPCNFKRQFLLGFNNYLRSALTLRGVGSRARA
jgi:hypothetical protein